MHQRTSFVGGPSGKWKVASMTTLTGSDLPQVETLDVIQGTLPAGFIWALHGISSNIRYTTKEENDTLKERQPVLNRPEATCAALIPIKKLQSWWDLAQDERRTIMEDRSEHIKTGIKYLPAIARKLYHSRDLGEAFDFLTWFEFDPKNANYFNELVGTLRTTEEWKYVNREIDIRLLR